MKKVPKKQDLSRPEVRLKYEIAEEIGLMDKVNKTGWKSLTARESGKLGGIIRSRNLEKNKSINNETPQNKET